MKRLTPHNILELSDYFLNLKFPLADINPLMFNVWYNFLKLKYIQDEKILYTIGHFEGIPYLWGPPLGIPITLEVLDKGINLIMEERSKLGVGNEYPEILYFWKAHKLFSELLKKNEFKIIHQAQEYIYETHKLANLSGSELKRKRKSRNRFINKYKPTIKKYSSKYDKAMLLLLEKWKVQKEKKLLGKNYDKFIAEYNVCKNALNRGLPFEGVVAFVNSSLVAFSIGYRHSEDTFNCIFEKTDLSKPGISVYIFSELGKFLMDNYRYINAGEDWNVDYLKEAKLRWKPVLINRIYSIKRIIQ